MKIFFSIATITFSLVGLLPLVNVFVSDMDNAIPYMNTACPIYLTVGIVGMLTMAYMGDKYENKI